MTSAKLLAALEEVAASLSIKVSYERIKKNTLRQPKGGLCRVHDEHRVIVHKLLTDDEKAQVLIEALKGLDLENIYISPEVRQAIEGASPLLKHQTT